MDISVELIRAAFESFGGMAHRLQTIDTHRGITFVNDSKATNAEAARHALSAFDNIYWIAGGRAKTDSKGHLGLDALAPHFEKIRAAYLIGEAAQAFADALPVTMPTEIAETMQRAVHAAADKAQADEVEMPIVLLSPACASFDQFVDFEARGAAFCEAVAAWKAGAQ